MAGSVAVKKRFGSSLAEKYEIFACSIHRNAEAFHRLAQEMIGVIVAPRWFIAWFWVCHAYTVVHFLCDALTHMQKASLHSVHVAANDAPLLWFYCDQEAASNRIAALFPPFFTMAVTFSQTHGGINVFVKSSQGRVRNYRVRKRRHSFIVVILILTFWLLRPRHWHFYYMMYSTDNMPLGRSISWLGIRHKKACPKW